MTNWLEKDLTYNWHPYTQMSTLREQPPLLITRAEGLRLYDDAGNWYYDTISSWWCNVYGHGHPRLREAVTRQMAELDHVLFGSIAHQPAITLAERLIDHAPPGVRRVFYSDNGSTAVEVALKMSVQYWRNTGRPEKGTFINLDRGYHGDTVGCMSVSNVELYRDAFAPLLFNTYQAATPDCYRCACREECPAKQGQSDLPCLASLAALLREHAEEVAAIILEPLLLGAGGMVVYPPAYLAGAARLARAYDVHLILDEVATGFGRTGTFFACEQAGVSPDFLCISKGLTGGTLPLSATLTTEAIYDAFLGAAGGGKTFYHGHTYTANPIGCALALAGLDLFEETDLLGHVATISPQLQAGMRRFADLPYVGDVRGIGMVAALELVEDRATRVALPGDHPLPAQVYQAGLREGLLLRPIGNVIYLWLPQVTTEEELADILTRFARVLTRVLC